MPALVAVAGAASIGTGIAGFTMGAGLTLANISAGAMIVGGGLSIVGAATGNKDLQKVGGILSLAGGIGTLADNMMSEAATVAGETIAGDQALTAGAEKTAVAAKEGALAAPGKAAEGLAVEDAAAALKSPIADAGKASVLDKTNLLDERLASMAKMEKYNALIGIAGGVGDYYAKQDEISAMKGLEGERLALEKEKQAKREANINAPATVNIAPITNEGSMLYKGVTPRSLQV